LWQKSADTSVIKKNTQEIEWHRNRKEVWKHQDVGKGEGKTLDTKSNGLCYQGFKRKRPFYSIRSNELLCFNLSCRMSVLVCAGL